MGINPDIYIADERWRAVAHADLGYTAVYVYEYAGTKKEKCDLIRIFSDDDRPDPRAEDLLRILPKMHVVPDMGIEDIFGEYPRIKRVRGSSGCEDWFLEGRHIFHVSMYGKVNWTIECRWSDLQTIYPFLRSTYLSDVIAEKEVV